MTEPDLKPGPRDPGLSSLYRAAASDEPPAALDAAILAASRAALAPKPAPRLPWWKRLAVPASLAASAMLAVMLSLTMEHNAPEVTDAVMAKKSAPAAAPVAAAKLAPDSVPGSNSLAAPVVNETPPSPPAAARVERKEKMTGEAALARDSAVPLPTRVPATVSAPMPAPMPAEDRLAAPAVSAGKLENSAPERGRADATSAAPAAASAGASAPALEATAKRAISESLRPETAWLEEIRQLRREGKLEAAARRLSEFKLAYPSYTLPEDLKSPGN